MAYKLPTEDQLTQLTIEHWQKWLPVLASNLTKAGELEQWARNAARQTLEAVQEKVDQGMHPLEAYEMKKQEWCFLNPADWNEPEPA